MSANSEPRSNRGPGHLRGSAHLHSRLVRIACREEVIRILLAARGREHEEAPEYADARLCDAGVLAKLRRHARAHRWHDATSNLQFTRWHGATYLDVQGPDLLVLRYWQRLKRTVECPPCRRNATLWYKKLKKLQPYCWHLVHEDKCAVEDAVHGRDLGVERVSASALR